MGWPRGTLPVRQAPHLRALQAAVGPDLPPSKIAVDPIVHLELRRPTTLLTAFQKSANPDLKPAPLLYAFKQLPIKRASPQILARNRWAAELVVNKARLSASPRVILAEKFSGWTRIKAPHVKPNLPAGRSDFRAPVAEPRGRMVRYEELGMPAGTTAKLAQEGRVADHTGTIDPMPFDQGETVPVNLDAAARAMSPKTRGAGAERWAFLVAAVFVVWLVFRGRGGSG